MTRRKLAEAVRQAVVDLDGSICLAYGKAPDLMRRILELATGEQLAQEMARRRWAGVSDADRATHQAAAASSAWASRFPTPEARAAEMRRRRLKGLKSKT